MFKQNPSILIFFRVKLDAPLSSTDVNSYLIKGEGQSLSLRLFYESRSRFIANQSWSAKETVSQKIGENIEMLVCFICLGHKSGL